MTVPFLEDNDQTRARHEHLEALRRLVGNVYPNKFERTNIIKGPGGEDTISAIVLDERIMSLLPKHDRSNSPSTEDLSVANVELKKLGEVRIAGRLATPPRVMGKRAAFVHLSDGSERLQIYVREDNALAIHNNTGAPIEHLGSGMDILRLLDHGDFVGVVGFLFVTKKGELSVHVENIQFLAKALYPMPSKTQGLSNPETRQRKRYVDLIAGSLRVRVENEEKQEKEGDDEARLKPENLTSRQVFERRSKVITAIRHFLDHHNFIEVETPMLTPLATGAAAKPFETYHNALGIPLYARIAPELYLKRLLVGGFERVYELNRNFRNEGISSKHNPEFTMLEFYMAYADVNQMMDFAEELLRSVVYGALGHTDVRYGNKLIDFSKRFERMTMKEAIAKMLDRLHPRLNVLGGKEVNASWLEQADLMVALEDFFIIMEVKNQPLISRIEVGEESATTEQLPEAMSQDEIQEDWSRSLSKRTGRSEAPSAFKYGATLAGLFELLAEPYLIQPTFITDFPKPISPLSKASPADPSIAERFEYFVGGLESGNGFSELNDPEEQYQRFNDQVQQRQRGDEEAMVMDEDYIRALSYGMPPAAGIGLGIDRLVMLLANKQSIRDVIMFPHMRPEKRADDEG